MTSVLPAVLYRPFMLALLAALVAFGMTAPIAPVSAATLTVTKTADTNDGTCDADCSLREAIDVAVLGDTIDFSVSVTGTTTLAFGQLIIDKDLTINGPGAATLAIDGNASSRIFIVAGGVTASISGLTITNGSASGSGGGIYNVGSLDVASSTISNNTASSGGGGIYSTGTLTVSDSTVSGNSSVGTYNVGGGGIYSTGTLTVSDSTVSGNSTTGSGKYGGGIHSGGTLTLTDSTVSNNTASNGGGGIYNNGTATSTSSTVSGNSAEYAGGIWNASNATMTLADSTVSNNTATLFYGGGILNNLGTLILSPNPPKDTDGRREGSGRGWVRELQGRWPGVLG